MSEVYTTRSTTPDPGFVDGYERETLEKAVKQFNNHNFFEAHETLEPLWLKADVCDSGFYYGLIRICLAFRNLETKNHEGGAYLLNSAIDALEALPDNFKGVFLNEWLPEIRSTVVMVEELARANASFDFETVPHIHWEPHVAEMVAAPAAPVKQDAEEEQATAEETAAS